MWCTAPAATTVTLVASKSGLRCRRVEREGLRRHAAPPRSWARVTDRGSISLAEQVDGIVRKHGVGWSSAGACTAGAPALENVVEQARVTISASLVELFLRAGSARPRSRTITSRRVPPSSADRSAAESNGTERRRAGLSRVVELGGATHRARRAPGRRGPSRTGSDSGGTASSTWTSAPVRTTPRAPS